MDLPVELLRHGQRTHLLPLIDGTPFCPAWGPATTHARDDRARQLGTMWDGGRGAPAENRDVTTTQVRGGR